MENRRARIATSAFCCMQTRTDLALQTSQHAREGYNASLETLFSDSGPQISATQYFSRAANITWWTLSVEFGITNVPVKPDAVLSEGLTL
jgi:hypothetical protein